MGCYIQSKSVQSDHNQSSGMTMPSGWTVVLDVGKTLSKASLWDENGNHISSRSRPNQSVIFDGVPVLDAHGIEGWLVQALSEFANLGPIDSIVPVAHGAGAALVRAGQLQYPPLDYEWAGVSTDRQLYNQQRDSYAKTGSPALPCGLNLGIQLDWLESRGPARVDAGQILPWAQYWAWLLCGVAASEVTSLGCHTDLWRPYERGPSDLAVRRGWADRLAPLSAADKILGTLRSPWSKATGLSSRVQIYCGLHDSNAALLAVRGHPDAVGQDATVLSTGTWFVAMRSPLNGGCETHANLPETRDCLVNVDVESLPVPSSRFMGGREIELLAGADVQSSDSPASLPSQQAAAIRAIESGAMILPSMIAGVGPYPNATRPPSIMAKDPSDRRVLALIYAALLADVSLDLIGSRDRVFVEGRFSKAPIFVQTLASLRPASRVLISNEDNGVAQGALRLAKVGRTTVNQWHRAEPLPVDLNAYRAGWRAQADKNA
jgi:sugar (pentulose or hexulose) kinase